MRLLVKIGGAQLEDCGARDELASALRDARSAGHDVVVVHGGGNQIRALTRRLGIEDRYHDGLRVTDRDTAEAVLSVLAGRVNKELVQSLNAGDVPAVGLCGADANTFSARKHAPDGHDLGYVGDVCRVDPGLVLRLLGAGIVPVIATVAPLDAAQAEPRDAFYNINADSAAGPLAAAFGADALLFLTDVPAVLDAQGTRVAELCGATAHALRQDGVISGGMLPKVQAALVAATAMPRGVVKIAPAAGPGAIRAALSEDVGTRFVADRATEVGADG